MRDSGHYNFNFCEAIIAFTASSRSGGVRSSHRRARANLEGIDYASTRASEVFETIRGLFVNSDAEKRLLDINSLVLHTLRLLSDELKAHSIEVKLQQTCDLPSFMGHQTQLQEVILNLVQNAIDAMSSVSDRPRTLLEPISKLSAAVDAL